MTYTYSGDYVKYPNCVINNMSTYIKEIQERFISRLNFGSSTISCIDLFYYLKLQNMMKIFGLFEYSLNMNAQLLSFIVHRPRSCTSELWQKVNYILRVNFVEQFLKTKMSPFQSMQFQRPAICVPICFPTFTTSPSLLA